MLIFIIFLWIALAIVVGVMAVGRGRKGVGWTILACLISPVVAGGFLLAITDRSPHAKAPIPATHMACPACGGRILKDARVCQHCKSNVADTAIPTPDPSSAARQGYWFDTPDTARALVREGKHVRLVTAATPWMVVDESLASIVIGSQWPGQLWRVQVETLGDMSGLVAQPGYWRAAAIELLEALPLSRLFGPNGEAVLALLEHIKALTRTQAQALAANVDPGAPAAYGRAWVRWSREGQGGESVDADADADADAWQGALAASRRRDKERSPIHSGFLLIHAQLRQRAQEIDGDDAFVLIEEDGETEQVLSPLWQQASAALLYAAMAQGAPQYVSADDAMALNRAWSVAMNKGGA